MDINIKPVFSFSLNYKVFEKLVTCGKYDGIHSCLTVVTNADKILIHTPHKRYGLQNSKLSVSEIKNDIAMLNMNFPIRAIVAGKLQGDDERDVLVIGSASHFLVYHVDENYNLFQRDFHEGVRSISIGSFANLPGNTLIVGGNAVVKGFNPEGNEIFWLITAGGVNSLLLMDVDKDGQNELIVGTDDGCIKIYKKDALQHEFTEGNEIQHLMVINQNQFMYSVKNGTIGVFDESVRMWRIKSKTRVTAMAMYDILGCENKQIIVGWKSGKIDVRDARNGDVLFKMKLNDFVCGIASNDYRGIGVLDLVIVTADGEIRGYSTPTVNLLNLHNLADDEMNCLLSQKQKLLLELKHYENNIKFNKEVLSSGDSQFVQSVPDNIGVIPSNTRLQIGISTSYDSTDMNIDITVSTNNATTIRAVLIFADQLFKEETLIAHLTKDVSRILIPLKTVKDNAQDIHIKAFVGYPTSVQFHVFELTRQLPKFAMYTIPQSLTGSPKSISYINSLSVEKTPGHSYVQFRISERLKRICIWINQVSENNFLLPSDIEYMTSSDSDATELKLNLISLRTGKNVCLHFINDGKTRFYTEDIGLAGDLIQSLVQFLNIENMDSSACFPVVYEEIRELFSKLQGLQETEKQINSEIIDNINQVKSHLIRAEDARYYNGDDVIKYHNEMMNTNEDLVKSYKIRLVNTGEVQLALKRIHSILYSASKLRVGTFAASVISKFKDALKTNNIEAVLKIIELGEM
ncbi:Bardet-Biedl syndrome 2 protein homolog isoform X1 [Topomyia yanbarensis]|uniref:Bardet-Biedl syndrome 2 protein homolog isoform X1 n=1 Tax=Topomyia yanbarensis TaxID=2498891 RepID=UPI00273A8E0A|nr:Bardet-Biedl syndrome 2 protein homolog isoform X1 [Topomyia yanbarensis]XP_058820190.1 Bardet-Biedl syndrome 2 protein homolog isoform X1 [Topomyia yanbarensis]